MWILTDKEVQSRNWFDLHINISAVLFVSRMQQTFFNYCVICTFCLNCKNNTFFHNPDSETTNPNSFLLIYVNFTEEEEGNRSWTHSQGWKQQMSATFSQKMYQNNLSITRNSKNPFNWVTIELWQKVLLRTPSSCGQTNRINVIGTLFPC